MPPKKPARPKTKKPGWISVRPRAKPNVQAKRNATAKMMEGLWNAAQGSSQLETLPAKDMATLLGIRNRLIANPESWTIADYTNVLKIHRRVFGRKAKPESFF